MSTIIRPEISRQKEYWIERHRYYELKHFCLQYPIWKKALSTLNGFSKSSINIGQVKSNNEISPTEKCAEERLFYSDRIRMLERIAKETDDSLSIYILKAVTEGLSYDCLKAQTNIPCCKDTYYNLYRRFFWLLNEERQ